MEPEVRAFLQRISYSLGIGLLWMILNTAAGIRFDLAFIHGSISTGNIIFYIWFVISTVLMLWLYVRLWKKPLQ
ncbi:hypothetical protein BH11BAC6_BH11BAC6_14290 [soil metagenome]